MTFAQSPSPLPGSCHDSPGFPSPTSASGFALRSRSSCRHQPQESNQTTAEPPPRLRKRWPQHPDLLLGFNFSRLTPQPALSTPDPQFRPHVSPKPLALSAGGAPGSAASFPATGCPFSHKACGGTRPGSACPIPAEGTDR